MKLSDVRSIAGKKGGSAKHKQRGLQLVPRDRRLEISKMGVEARKKKVLVSGQPNS